MAEKVARRRLLVSYSPAPASWARRTPPPQVAAGTPYFFVGASRGVEDDICCRTALQSSGHVGQWPLGEHKHASRRSMRQLRKVAHIIFAGAASRQIKTHKHTPRRFSLNREFVATIGASGHHIYLPQPQRITYSSIACNRVATAALPTASNRSLQRRRRATRD